MLNPQTILLLNLLLAACVQDLLTDRVSNTLIAAGWGCGIVTAWNCGVIRSISAVNAGTTGLASPLVSIADSLAGSALPLLCFWILFRFRMMGAGDIKLLGVCGAFLGVKGSLRTMAASVICGGIMALVLFIFRRNFMRRIRYFLNFIVQYLQDRKIHPYRQPEHTDALFHFTPAILCGAVFALSR